ncbi:hypothetical protein C1H46_034868 [Malus baccata]|uniref:Uncharacterized protein n=1 Tax=Malus baccata TaxID=106549 RepID=A0A540KZB0_MALBA|nr:hypothetical protein C1H46_034868 [Malus baccata]
MVPTTLPSVTLSKLANSPKPNTVTCTTSSSDHQVSSTLFREQNLRRDERCLHLQTLEHLDLSPSNFSIARLWTILKSPVHYLHAPLSDSLPLTHWPRRDPTSQHTAPAISPSAPSLSTRRSHGFCSCLVSVLVNIYGRESRGIVINHLIVHIGLILELLENQFRNHQKSLMLSEKSSAGGDHRGRVTTAEEDIGGNFVAARVADSGSSDEDGDRQELLRRERDDGDKPSAQQGQISAPPPTTRRSPPWK